MIEERGKVKGWPVAYILSLSIGGGAAALTYLSASRDVPQVPHLWLAPALSALLFGAAMRRDFVSVFTDADVVRKQFLLMVVWSLGNLTLMNEFVASRTTMRIAAGWGWSIAAYSIVQLLRRRQKFGRP